MYVYIRIYIDRFFTFLKIKCSSPSPESLPDRYGQDVDH